MKQDTPQTPFWFMAHGLRDAGYPCMPIASAAPARPAFGFLGRWEGQEFGGLLPAAYLPANDETAPPLPPAA